MPSKRDIKKQNPDYVIDIIDILSLGDPSNTNKYLPYMVKISKDWLRFHKEQLINDTFKELFDVLSDFEDLSQRGLLENNNIYSYKSPKDIAEAIKLGKEKVTRSQVKKKETIVMFEDDRWLVIRPLTSRSSNLYGKGTKWCVASEREDFKRHFKSYTENGILFFVIDKTVKDENTRTELLSKVAFHYDIDNDKLTVWDTADNEIGTKMMKVLSSMPTEGMVKVTEILNSGVSNSTMSKERKVID